MQKDVIYIDVEDDITAIIGKVKSAEHDIIALVPPKRIGVLQSAVNVRLINRAAEQAKKKLVLITNNHALMGLAAASSIPVAKNLQSRPEIPELTALDSDDGDAVIDGSDLPVGEHARLATPAPTADETARDNAVDSIGTTDKLGTAAVASSLKNPLKKSTSTRFTKSPVKVPNFNTTRKKLFLIIGGVLLLLALLIWAIFFAPNARILITARTANSAASSDVTLKPDVETNLEAKTLKSVQKQASKDISIPINATGTKDVGERASGTATVYVTDAAELDIYRNDETYTLPAGTALRATNGKSYQTATTVSFGPDNIRSSGGRMTTRITATESGSAANGASGALSGTPSGMRASVSGSTSGGTDKTVPVATQSDIDIAMAKIAETSDANKVKNDLSSQLDGAIVIDASFQSDNSEVKPNVTANQDFGTTTPAVTGKVKYTMSAVEKSEADKYLDAYFAKEIDGKANQHVYNNGAGDATFTNVAATDGGFTAMLTANGKIGPKINEDELKEFAKGKRYGDIQSHIEAIEGIDSADVKFSPFWVSSAPNDVNRIKIEFKVNDQ